MIRFRYLAVLVTSALISFTSSITIPGGFTVTVTTSSGLGTSGITVSGNLQLPAAVGGGEVTVENVRITASGVTVEAVTEGAVVAAGEDVVTATGSPPQPARARPATRTKATTT